MASKRIPIACSLDDAGLEVQARGWKHVGAHLLRSERRPDGVTFWFAPSIGPALADVVARESACCAFLSLVTARDGDSLRLDVTSDDADALPVIEFLAEAVRGARP